MFEKQLIERVKCVDHLYNTRSRLYKNSKKRNLIWQSISKQLGVDVIQCRQRWKSLRDRFVREHRKVLCSSDRSELWVHYNQLLFLKDYLRPPKYTYVRGLCLNVPSVEVKCEPILDAQLDIGDDPLCKIEPPECNTDEEYSEGEYSDGGNFSYEDGSTSTETTSKKFKSNGEDSFGDFIGPHSSNEVNEFVDQKSSTLPSEDTENMLFMRMIAKKMDLLPLDSQGALQIEILTVVNNEVRRIINKK